MNGGVVGRDRWHPASACLDPENLDINKPLKFHNEETSIH